MKTIDGETINRQTAKHKFGGDPMAEYLHALSLDGVADFVGESDFGLWTSLFGRRILLSNDQGFVWVNKFDTEAQAQAEYALIETEYNNWWITASADEEIY